MKIKYSLIPLIAICLSFISATSVPKAEIKVMEDTLAKVNAPFKPPSKMKAKKMGFFQRLAFKIAMHKLKKHHYKIADDTAKADNMANASLWFGALALLFALIPWYTVFLVIPLGILAIIFGSNAKKSGTKKKTKANIGAGLGIAGLILFVIYLIVALIWISAWSSF
jgi:ABC-type multidrug transport system fused ATPase/permease subunit